jgi:hypothetical protein
MLCKTDHLVTTAVEGSITQVHGSVCVFQRLEVWDMLNLFVFISSTMRSSGYGLGASYLATHNHSAIPEVTLKSSN